MPLLPLGGINNLSVLSFLSVRIGALCSCAVRSAEVIRANPSLQPHLLPFFCYPSGNLQKNFNHSTFLLNLNIALENISFFPQVNSVFSLSFSLAPHQYQRNDFQAVVHKLRFPIDLCSSFPISWGCGANKQMDKENGCNTLNQKVMGPRTSPVF